MASPETQTATYSRSNPFLSLVTRNILLTGPGSEKETRHIELSLEGSGLTYLPGDAVGIFATTRSSAVAELLAALGIPGDAPVKDHAGAEISLREALTSRLYIGKLGRGSLNNYAKLAGNAALSTLALPENKAKVEEYLWGREFIDLCRDFPGGVRDPQELFTILPKITPRMYSLASSQAMHPDSVHMAVRVVLYESHGMKRQGLVSGYLGGRAPEGSSLPMFFQTNDKFRLPQDPTTPVIMIGPGTGVAPFRAFIEHRSARGESGDMWLFFGDQREASDFLYRDEFLRYKAQGVLTRLDTAFSRDQPEKIYVQTRMRQQAKELYRWLEEGAHFYVCGDATRMAKDVETALLDVIAAESGRGPEGAAEYLAAMKKAKRYQRDVY